MTYANYRIFLKGLLLISTFIIIAYIIKAAELDSILNKAWIDSEIRSKGISGEIFFLGVGILATAVGIPRQAISFLAGYAFGLIPGVFIGVLSTAGGCIVSFYYARWLGRGVLGARHGDRIRRINEFLYKNTFSTTLLIRLLPAGNNLITNLAAGVSNVQVIPFLLGSALGYVPQTAIFALVGSGMNLNPSFRIGLGVVLFIISGILGIYLYRRICNEQRCAFNQQMPGLLS
ncbi:MAG: TVP38/TMEM64 family protein [Desulfobacteraceae bacterium]|nr:MAG: TVP38/TMEM64 family protein [Desulfobacteraceae bacterium]